MMGQLWCRFVEFAMNSYKLGTDSGCSPETPVNIEFREDTFRKTADEGDILRKLQQDTYTEEQLLKDEQFLFHGRNSLLHWAMYTRKEKVVERLEKHYLTRLDEQSLTHVFAENDDLMTPLDIAHRPPAPGEQTLSKSIKALRNHIAKKAESLCHSASAPKTPVGNESEEETKRLKNFFDIIKSGKKKKGLDGQENCESGKKKKGLDGQENCESGKKKKETDGQQNNESGKKEKETGGQKNCILEETAKSDPKIRVALLDEIRRTERKTKLCLDQLDVPPFNSQLGFREALIFINFLETVVGMDVFLSDGIIVSKKEKLDIKIAKKEYLRGLFELRAKEFDDFKRIRNSIIKRGRGSSCVDCKDFEQVMPNIPDAFDEMKRILRIGQQKMTETQEKEVAVATKNLPEEKDKRVVKPLLLDKFTPSRTDPKEVINEFVDSYISLRGPTSDRESLEKFEAKVRFHLVVNVPVILAQGDALPYETRIARNRNLHDFTEPLTRDHSAVVFEVYRSELAQSLFDCLAVNDSNKLESEMAVKLQETNSRFISEISLTSREVMKYFPKKYLSAEISWRNPSQQSKALDFITNYISQLALLSDVRRKGALLDDVLLGLSIERKLQILETFQGLKDKDPDIREVVHDYNRKVNIREVQERFDVYKTSVRSPVTLKRLVSNVFQMISSVMSIPDVKFLPLPISSVSLSSIISHRVRHGEVSENDITQNLLPHEKLTANQKTLVANKINALEEKESTACSIGDGLEVDILSVVKNVLCMFDQHLNGHKWQFDDVKEVFADRNFVAQLVTMSRERMNASIEGHVQTLTTELKKRFPSELNLPRDDDSLPVRLDKIATVTGDYAWKHCRETCQKMKTSWALIESWLSMMVRQVKNSPIASSYVAVLLGGRFSQMTRNVSTIVSEKMGAKLADLERDLKAILKTLVCENDYTTYLIDVLQCDMFHISQTLGTLVLENKDAKVKDVLEALLPAAPVTLRSFFTLLESKIEEKYFGIVNRVLKAVNDTVLDCINSGDLKRANLLLAASQELHDSPRRKTISTCLAKASVQLDSISAQRLLHTGKLRLHEGMDKERVNEQDAQKRYGMCLQVLSKVCEEKMALSMVSYAHCRLGQFKEASDFQTKLWDSLVRCATGRSEDEVFQSIVKISESSSLYHSLLQESTEHERFLNLPTVRSNLIFYELCAARKLYRTGEHDQEKFRHNLEKCARRFEEVYFCLQKQSRTTATNGEKRIVERLSLRVLARRFVVYVELARLTPHRKDYSFYKALELLILLHNRRQDFFGPLTNKVRYTRKMIQTALCKCFLKETHCHECFSRHSAGKEKFYNFYYTISPIDGCNGSCATCSKLFDVNGPYCRHVIPQRFVAILHGKEVRVDVQPANEHSLFMALLQRNGQTPSMKDVRDLRRDLVKYIRGRLDENHFKKAQWLGILNRTLEAEKLKYTVGTIEERTSTLLKALEKSETDEHGEPENGQLETIAAFADLKEQNVVVFTEALSPLLFLPLPVEATSSQNGQSSEASAETSTEDSTGPSSKASAGHSHEPSTDQSENSLTKLKEVSIVRRNSGGGAVYDSVVEFVRLGQSPEESLTQRDVVDVAVHRGHVRVRNSKDSERDSLFASLVSQTDSGNLTQKSVKALRSKVEHRAKAKLKLPKDLENSNIGDRDEILLTAFADLKRVPVKLYLEAPRPRLISPSAGPRGETIGIVYRPGLVPDDKGDYNTVRELTQEVKSLVFENFVPGI